MSYSDYLEGALLDHTFGISAFTAPANVFVALFTAAPSDSGGGTEVTGNAYARVSITNDATEWTRTVSSVTNDNTITFPTPTPGDWGTVTHFALFDAATAGNMLGWAALDNARVTAADVAVSFAAGALTVTLD